MADIRAYSTTADSNTDIAPEGMAPSGVNNAIRAVQGELAQLLTDMGGSGNTAGSATSYTITLSTTPAGLTDGLRFAATWDETCGLSPILNVNSLGAKKIRKISSVGEIDVHPGDLVVNGVYDLVYNTSADGSSGAWIVLNPANPNSLGVYDLAGLSSKDLAIPSGVSDVKFALRYLPSSAVTLSLRASRTAGVSFLTGASDYSVSSLTHNGATVTSAGGSLSSAGQIGTTDSLTMSNLVTGEVTLGAATDYPTWKTDNRFHNTTSGSRRTLYHGLVNSTGSIDALRFFLASGTFTTGRLVVEIA